MQPARPAAIEEESMVIRRIGPLSCAKVAAAPNAVAGLFVGVIFSLFSLAGGFASAAFAADPSRRTGFIPFAGVGVLAIVIFPILYAAMGFVGALIGTRLYNMAAGVVGGIKIDLE
jgi:xanthosine utilization system XapX-like protein